MVVQNLATYPYNKSDKDKLVKDSNNKISANEQENEFNNAVLNAPNKSDGNKLVKDSTIQICVNKQEKEENNVALNTTNKSDTDTICDISSFGIKFTPRTLVSAIKQQEKLLKKHKEKKSEIKFGNSVYKNSSKSIHHQSVKTKTQAKATIKKQQDGPLDQSMVTKCNKSSKIDTKEEPHSSKSNITKMIICRGP